MQGMMHGMGAGAVILWLLVVIALVLLIVLLVKMIRKT